MAREVRAHERSIFYVYFCQQLDKSSISFAALFNFQKDANLV